ncbi:MAG: hypothetical protein ACYTEN_05505, partial [Planctomycetota bacterium]
SQRSVLSKAPLRYAFLKTGRLTVKYSHNNWYRKQGQTSPLVALKHYAQTTEADMKEAARMTFLNDAENTVQNQVQPMTETSGNVQHEEVQDVDVSPCDCRNLPQHSEPYYKQDNACPVGVTGLEPATS